MKENSQPLFFQYKAKKTVIHKIPVGIKFFILIFSSFIIYKLTLTGFFFLSLVLLLALILAHTEFSTIRKNSLFLIYYFIFMYSLRIIGKPFTQTMLVHELHETLSFHKNLCFVLFMGTLFYETTSKLEIFSLFRKIESFFSRGKKNLQISSILSLTIIFIPQIFESWQQISTAWAARSSRKKRLSHFYKKALCLLPNLIINLLEFAEKTEISIRNRS